MVKDIGHLVAAALVCFIALPVEIDSRQMCWVCQYVHNGNGLKECASSPGNWSGADPRIKCEQKCIITADFDAVTGIPTFLYRGCADTTQKNGCDDNGNKHNCFFSCEGTHYCNDMDLSRSPLIKVKNGASELLRPWQFIVFSVVGFFL